MPASPSAESAPEWTKAEISALKRVVRDTDPNMDKQERWRTVAQKLATGKTKRERILSKVNLLMALCIISFQDGCNMLLKTLLTQLKQIQRRHSPWRPRRPPPPTYSLRRPPPISPPAPTTNNSSPLFPPSPSSSSPTSSPHTHNPPIPLLTPSHFFSSPTAASNPAPPPSHTHTLLLFLLNLVLWLFTSILFSLFSAVYLLSLLLLTPLTFTLTRNRNSEIVFLTKCVHYYSLTITIVELLSQFLPLFLTIPSSTITVLSTVGIDLYSEAGFTYTIIFPHLLISSLSYLTFTAWLVHQSKDAQQSHQSVLHSSNHPNLRSRLLSISPYWLTSFMLSLSFSSSLNPSVITLPLFTYTMVLYFVYNFSSKEDKSLLVYIFNKRVLLLISIYSGLITILSYIYQFNNIQLLLEDHSPSMKSRYVYLGFVHFQDSRSQGYMFEYFHTASLLSLYLLSMSKVMYWTHVEATKKVEGFRIGGIFESDRSTAGSVLVQNLVHDNDNNENEVDEDSDDDDEETDWDVYKTAKDIKISLGINRTTRPALNKVVNSTSSYIARFFVICNTMVKKVSSALMHLLKVYGQILCLLTYTTLSLERPTILGFVFCFIVFCGSIFPDRVFERGTPIVLIYTMGYSMVRNYDRRYAHAHHK